MAKRVCVIGGGISGLCTAYFLKTAGIDVTLIERSSETGGNIKTIVEGDFLIEQGPNSLLISPELYGLVTQLGLENEIALANPAAKTRYILKNGELTALPSGPLDLITNRTFSGKAKLRLLKEPFVAARASESESVADFFRRRLGPEIVEYAVDPFISGIFAGNPDKLSVMNAFPKLYEMEKVHGGLLKGGLRSSKKDKKAGSVPKGITRTISFKKGMQTLPNTITERLGDSVRLDTEVDEIVGTDGGRYLVRTSGASISSDEFDAVVLSTPAYVAAGMVEHMDPELSALLASVYYPPVAVVSAAFRTADVPRDLRGFGFLVPKKEGRKILGSLWPSSVFDGRAPKGHNLTTTFLGGSRNADIAESNEDELISTAVTEQKSILGIKGEPVFAKVKKWKHAIPQYNIGYEAVPTGIAKFRESNPGYFFCGNYYKGISVGDCIKNSIQTSEEVSTFLGVSKPVNE